MKNILHIQEIQVAVINNTPLGAIEFLIKDHFMITKLSILSQQKRNMNHAGEIE